MQIKSTIVHYKIHELTEYINWVYFFHAWDFPPRFASIGSMHGCDSCRAMWLTTFEENDRMQAAEAMQLHKEAARMLRELDGRYGVHAMYRLTDACADGDNIVMDGKTFPLLRQQTQKQNGDAYLCLSDFVKPAGGTVADTVGLFAATVDDEMENLYTSDEYNHLLVKTLCERLTEAAVEKLHREIRTRIWGYAPDEKLTYRQLFNEKFQGIRPAVGYPSLPDLSVNFLMEDMLGMHNIGISLTENGMMIPRASVSGLMISHPQAKYFAVGKIDGTQLEDYARRRGMKVEEMKKFLNANL